MRRQFCKNIRDWSPVHAGQWLFVAILLSLALTGCVQRRMTIRSNPPGALVYVDDHPTPIGTTPVSHDFIYYGTRKIRLVKDGFETLTVLQPIHAPWYEYPVVDFFSENLVPGQIRDQRILEFQMKPQAVTQPEQLVARAEELRRGVHASTGTAAESLPGTVRGASTLNPPAFPATGNPEVVPAPQGIGGQMVAPIPTQQ